MDPINTEKYKFLRVKLAIFVQKNVAQDIAKKPILMTEDVIPTYSDETSLRFAYTYTFNFIVQDMLNELSEEELESTYLFLVLHFQ